MTGAPLITTAELVCTYCGETVYSVERCDIGDAVLHYYCHDDHQRAQEGT